MGISLIRLLHLCSTVFPTGVFSHSYGYETLLEDGYANTAEDFDRYISAVLKSGSAKAEAIIIKFCLEASERLRYWDELCTAVKPTKELRAASSKTGRAFLRAFEKMYPEKSDFCKELPYKNYAVVFGAACGCLGIPTKDAVEAFLTSTVLSNTSAAIKLIPLSQLDGQLLVERCYATIAECANAALSAGEDEIFSFSPMADISSMRHEEQYSRMYMS
ncbi:MAG: urease accessory protein UreF [Oscillospiraceae bacterium]